MLFEHRFACSTQEEEFVLPATSVVCMMYEMRSKSFIVTKFLISNLSYKYFYFLCENVDLKCLLFTTVHKMYDVALDRSGLKGIFLVCLSVML